MSRPSSWAAIRACHKEIHPLKPKSLGNGEYAAPMVVHIARLRWRKVPIFAKFVGGGGRLQLLARSAPFASRWQTDGGRPGLSQSFELTRVPRPSSAWAGLRGWMFPYR